VSFRPTCAAGIALLSLAAIGCNRHHLDHTWFRDERVRNVPEADFRQPITRAELAYGSGYYLANAWRAPTADYGRSRPYVIVDVGNPTPIIAWSNQPIGNPPAPVFAPYDAKGSGTNKGEQSSVPWTMQFTIPIAFHLFWDAFTTNNPIVDTDYTFGFDLSARTALAAGTEQRFGVYWGHISTHLGDEYVISGRQTGAPFPRVNVSMFPWHVNASQRWYYGGTAANGARSYVQITGQLDGPCVSCHDTAFYYTYASETDGVSIPTIGPGVEPTLALDWRWLKRWFQVANPEAALTLEPSSWNAGLLLGRRRIFPYLPTTSARYGTEINATFGYRFPATVGPGVNYVELYARGYHGPNPYGQLRNQASFSLVALGAKVLH